MLSLFVMVSSFWMVCQELKTDFFRFLSVIEETDVVVNSISDDGWEANDELTGALSDEFDIWD